MTTIESRRLQRIIYRVLHEADSDVIGAPLHGPVIKETVRRARLDGLSVTARQVKARLGETLFGAAE